MAERNDDRNGILVSDCGNPDQTDAKDQTSAKKDQEKGAQKDEKKKKLYKSVTVQLKGPYRKIEYSLYRPAKGEAYRPFGDVKIAPELIKKSKKKWKLEEAEIEYSRDLYVLAFQAFFDFPKDGPEKSQTERAKIQLLILLAQIASILVKNFAPGLLGHPRPGGGHAAYLSQPQQPCLRGRQALRPLPL